MELVAHQPTAQDPVALLQALTAAAATPVDRVELDVLLGDGQLVVAHDRRAARRATLDLAQALAALEPTGTDLLLDIKGDETAGPLGELLAAGDWPARTMLAGELQAVERAASIATGATRAWTLPAGRGAIPPAHAGPLNASTRGARARVRNAGAWAIVEGRADALCVDRRFITPPLVAAVHTAGGRVFAWTVDRPAQARRLAAQHVDGLITSRPAEVAAALLSR